MNNRQLKALVAVVETGSFSSAAKKLFQTQPGVSIAIKNLEENLGLKLLSRDQYHVELTAEGKAIYYKAKKVLQQSEELIDLGKELSSGVEAEIWIAVDSLFPLTIILNLLKGYIEKYSSTRFNFSVEYVEGAKVRLVNGDANLAITQIDQSYPNLDREPLMAVSLMPVATPDFPASLHKKPLKDEELKDYIQVIVGDSSQSILQETITIYPKNTIAALEDSKRWVVSDNATKKQIILAGLAWGRLPKFFIQKELAEGSLVPIDSETIKPVEPVLSLYKRNDRSPGLITSQLWDEIQEVCHSIKEEEF